jgi:hypothetical protein
MPLLTLHRGRIYLQVSLSPFPYNHEAVICLVAYLISSIYDKSGIQIGEEVRWTNSLVSCLSLLGFRTLAMPKLSHNTWNALLKLGGSVFIGEQEEFASVFVNDVRFMTRLLSTLQHVHATPSSPTNATAAYVLVHLFLQASVLKISSW